MIGSEASLNAATEVDNIIFDCMRLDNPRSFYLFAGAGTGKTGSLVAVLDRLRTEHKEYLRLRSHKTEESYFAKLLLRSQRIGIITYTNAACDEIKRRLEFDPVVEVSTIHSFAWSLIGPFHTDIRGWLRQNLLREIEELKAAQAKGRSGSQAAIDRANSITNKEHRVSELDTIRKFVYSPTGDNRGRGALNHTEVISMAAEFLTNKDTLQNILVSQFPVLLIDESQDTNRYLMDALLSVQKGHKTKFCLGLFGDAMQRIYADGKVGLAESLSSDWVKPAKYINYRSANRIIELINRIRAGVDDYQQTGTVGAPEGTVRLFIFGGPVPDKMSTEAVVSKRMADITGDDAWILDGGRKTLILEHHMAARRMGFEELFGPLYKISRYQTGLMDGTLPPLRFLAKDVLPLVKALRSNDRLTIAAIIRKLSPLLDSSVLRAPGVDQLERLKQAKVGTEALLELWSNDAEPSFLDVLICIAEHKLFEIPEVLRSIVARGKSEVKASTGDPIFDVDEATAAWETSMATSFSQINAFDQYVSGLAPFGTHQGVKGLEFPRVMVIIDDEEARGFLFSYEKLFGAKPKSETDIKNESQGAETSITRTSRLFYVTCSRAKSSLAIVAYSSNPGLVKARVIEEGWLMSNEIEIQ